MEVSISEVYSLGVDVFLFLRCPRVLLLHPSDSRVSGKRAVTELLLGSPAGEM